MTIESTLGIIGSLLAIGGAIWSSFKLLQKKDLKDLFSKLADKNTSLKEQRKILYKVNAFLTMSGQSIPLSYISGFSANGRSKLTIFHDICTDNDIEPTAEICKKLVGADEPKFRKEWIAARTKSKPEQEHSLSQLNKPIVYMSKLFDERFHDTCNQLISILERHGIAHKFLKGTKDIWCRDYMPVQTPSGKLIQFKYDPSYLKEKPEYAETRSDVKFVCEANSLLPEFSDINLDGGNVVMYGNKAIITDRIFSENHEISPADLVKRLNELLECEIIIIPAYKPYYDFTGHADGMIRFVDSNTVLVNDLEQDFKYIKEAMTEKLQASNLQPINFPFFEYKIKGNYENAIGVYINYLEVDNLIIMPVFNVPGNQNEEALVALKRAFPEKKIETVDYTAVAQLGGVINCTTWVYFS